MKNIKCPFCDKKLQYDKNFATYQCDNPMCKESTLMYGSKEMWQVLNAMLKVLRIYQQFMHVCIYSLTTKGE